MEVCPMLEELLLFKTVSECELAYSAQACLLQTCEILVECGGLYFGHIFDCAQYY